MTDTKPDLNHLTNPDAWEAKHLSWNQFVILLPLTSGKIAIFGRDFILHTILSDAPSTDEIQQLSKTLYAKMTAQSRYHAESQFYGEPTEKQMAHDIRNAQARAQAPKPKPISRVEPLEI